MNILILCVNYNTYDALKNYLISIENAIKYYKKSCKIHVVIADNSEKKEVDDGSSIPTFATRIFTGKNLGYFGGISYVIKKMKLKLSDYNYVIISNVDLKISNKFLYDMESIPTYDNIGCVAPAIFSLSEKVNRNPKIVKRISKKRLLVLRIMYAIPILYYLYKYSLYKCKRNSRQKCNMNYIYAPHGSFMIFTDKMADFLQNMNYSVFLFGEEIYIAENIKRMNLKVLYYPQIKIYDMDHISTGKMKNKYYFQHNFEAIDMLIKEYFDE